MFWRIVNEASWWVAAIAVLGGLELTLAVLVGRAIELGTRTPEGVK